MPDDRYLWRERLKMAVGYFVVFGIVASLVEGAAFPARRPQLAVTFAGYAMVCAAALTATWCWPRHARAVTRCAAVALVPMMADYQLAVGNPAEIAILPLVLYCCAAAAILSDLTTQVLVCLAVVLTVAATAWLPFTHLLPVVYSLAIVVGAASITIPAARRFDRHQRAVLGQLWRRT